MKLYADPLAPNPRRVLWLMAEKGIEDIELVNTPTLGAELRDPAYVAKTGLPQVPALELDDGQVLTESLAICRYLEALYPQPNLFGLDPREAAVIEMWTRRAELMLANPMMMMVRHGHPALAPLGPQHADVSARGAEQVRAALPLFEALLAESAFIGAGRISIADIVAASSFGFARMIRYELAEDLPNLRRWWAALRDRPGAKRGR